MEVPPVHVESHAVLVRRGIRLSLFTIGWTCIQGVVGVASGLAAGSIALMGFGVNSYVEVLAASVVLWRLVRDGRGREPDGHRERLAVRLIAATFLLLAVGVTVESISRLVEGTPAIESPLGIGLAVISVLMMPFIAAAKRRLGAHLGSSAVSLDAAETRFGVWLSSMLLIGLLLNAWFGWWWADPVAALGIAAAAAIKGIRHLGGGSR